MENKGLFIRRSIYAVLFTLSLVFISFRGGNLSYMLFFMMCVNTLLSIVYIFGVFFSIKIFQSIPERRVTKKENIPYHLELRNESILAFRSVRLQFMEQLSGIRETDKLVSVDMEPGQGIDIDSQLYCKYSGTYFVGVDTIEIMDYFRIFRIRFPMPQKMKVTVKPRILKPDNIGFIMEEMECHNSGQKGKIEYLPDNEVKRYAAGDNRRLIHWKNSAKRQELMVRSLTNEEISEYAIIVDGRVEAAGFEDKIIICDKIREITIALVNYIYCSGYNVLAVLENSYEKDVFSQRDFDEFYRKMIDYGFAKEKEFDKLLLSWNRNTEQSIPFFVISSNPGRTSDDIWDEVKRLRSIHVIDVSLLDDMEGAFKY